MKLEIFLVLFLYQNNNENIYCMKIKKYNLFNLKPNEIENCISAYGDIDHEIFFLNCVKWTMEMVS